MANVMWCNRKKPDDEDLLLPPESPRPIPTSPVDIDSEFYNMKHKRRGLALVFCHWEFDRKLHREKRVGWEVDLKNLEGMFSELGFEKPIVCENFTLAQIKRKLLEIQAEDFTDCDCLVVTIMTHGCSGNILMARDAKYKLEQVWSMFTADLCPSLALKPKLFFIQACKGSEKDVGQTLAKKSSPQDYSVDSEASFTTPTHADFLIFYSSFENFVSYRNEKRGSVFIDVLCDVLSKNYKEKDLMYMTTMVTRRVAIEFTSSRRKRCPFALSMLLSCRRSSDDYFENGKQCPLALSSLSRVVKF